MKFSSLMDTFKPSIFETLEIKRRSLVEQGKEIINLSIGTPDLPPSQEVMDAISKAAQDPENYKYAVIDSKELQEAVINWYKRRYNVELTADEITSVYGSQEGIAHISFIVCDPGDIVLAGTPGYQIFAFGPKFAKAVVHPVLLKEENGFLMDFDTIDPEIAKKAKMMVVSYPSNPLSTVANDEFYHKLIAFAKKYDIIVIHDNAYSDFIHDGTIGKSFLNYEGAKDVGIEFNSLSKSYNVTGLRISFAVGNKEIIRAFKTLRSQIDYGISKIDQIAAIAALETSQATIEKNQIAYRERAEALAAGLNRIGWKVPKSQATMFSWVPIPEGFTSEQFALDLLEKAGVIVVPGTAFGEGGEGYVRIALVQPVEVMERVAQKIEESGILKK